MSMHRTARSGGSQIAHGGGRNTGPAPDVGAVEGPDFAPADADIFESAQYAAARIIALRSEVEGLRATLDACR